jgi:hypothetical protein
MADKDSEIVKSLDKISTKLQDINNTIKPKETEDRLGIRN